MALIQLDFFQETDISIMKQQIKEIDESTHRIRKGIFAKHGELNKLVISLNERLEILERNICNSRL